MLWNLRLFTFGEVFLERKNLRHFGQSLGLFTALFLSKYVFQFYIKDFHKPCCRFSSWKAYRLRIEKGEKSRQTYSFFAFYFFLKKRFSASFYYLRVNSIFYNSNAWLTCEDTFSYSRLASTRTSTSLASDK